MMGRLADTTVVEPDTKAIRALQREFPATEFSVQDYATFLKALVPSEAAVIVALPNQLHVAAVRLALDQGRHVLCEKPLALRAQDCSSLRALAADKRRLLKVAMSRRYLPSLMLTCDIIAARELGEVRSVEVRDCHPFGWQPRSFAFFSREAGGILSDLGVHYLDYIETLVGELQPLAYSDDAKGGTESSLSYILLASGVRVDMRLSRLDQTGAYIKIECERGQIRVEKGLENEVVVTPSRSLRRRISADKPFDDPAWPQDFHGSFCQMLADFERAVAGRTTRIADVTDAERTAALIEWGYERRSDSTPKVMSSAPPADRTRVLITGATGFIGGHLVERLSQDANDIRVAARTPAKCANVSRFPVEIVPTDLLDVNSVQEAVAGARIVCHLAYGTDGKSPSTITIDGTKNIVEAAIAAGAECVVILSTMYVFGFPQSGAPVDELSPYRPYGGEYGRSKAAMERWCLERARSSLPTRIVVLNPTCVFGPGGVAYTSLPVELVRQGMFCWINDGTGLCNYNYVENLVDAIVAATRVTRAHGNRFIINDGAVTWREFFEPLIRPFVGGAIPSFTPAQLKKLPRFGEPFKISDLVLAAISAPAVRDAAKRSKAIRNVAALTRSMRATAPQSSASDAEGASAGELEKRFPPDWLATLYAPATNLFIAKKANDVLDWKPKIDLADALQKSVEWLIESRGLPERPGLN